jgi:hypothetical protein
MDELMYELERASWNVAKAKEIVVRQTCAVKSLRYAEYADAVIAEDTLELFIGTLKALEDHEHLLRSEIKQRVELRGRLLRRR